VSAEERSDLDAFADRDEESSDSHDARYPYGGAPSRPTGDDEQWRRQAPPTPRARTGAPVAVAQLLGGLARGSPPTDEYADLRTPSGQLRCKRCGKEQPASVLALCQPLYGGRREFCSSCVSKDVRALADQTREACRAYKAGNRSVASELVDLLGRHDAQSFMQAVDDKRDGAKGGAWS
jgi:hypothetical protein